VRQEYFLKEEKSVRQKATILLINDQFQLREFIRCMLMDKYRIASVRGVEEAFKYMADHPVNLVLLDVKIARLDGLTILREIKERYPATVVILLAAYASIETIRKAFQLGAYGFLMKPFDINKFVSTDDEALETGRWH
jgi:DNA-binding NtrC family response regulator